jgi:hypothetical protein
VTGREQSTNPCRAGRLHAARSGIGLVDGVKARLVLRDASEALKSCMKAAPKPKRTKRVRFGAACPDIQQERLRAVAKPLRDARGVETKQSFSEILAAMAARNAVKLGHGAKEEYELDFDAFMDHLLDCRDGVCRPRVERKLAARKRHTNEARHQLERKQLAGASWRTVDVYRNAFLVKHVSRGKMSAETRGLLAFMCARVRCAGDHWAADEQEAEELRAAATAMLKDEADAKARRADNAYRQFTKAWFAAHGEGLKATDVMCECSDAWRTAAENPANEARETPTTGPLAWRAAAASAAAAADLAHAAAPANDAAADMEVDEEPTPTNADDETTEAEELPPREFEIANTDASRKAARCGAVAFAEIGGYYVNDSEPNDDDDDGPDMRTDDTYIKAAFLNEMGKDRTLPSGFGPIGLAQLRELGERLQRRGVRELHAISREAHEATGEAFTGTAHAREQFTWSTARIARRHNVGDDASHHDMKKRPDLAPPEQLYALKPGQAYFVWNVNDLVRKLGKDGEDVRVRGGARLHVEERPCRLSGTARSWWEKDAIEDVILPLHATANGGDGVKRKDLKKEGVVPSGNARNGGGVLSIYCFVPRPNAATAGAGEGDGVGAGGDGGAGDGAGVGGARGDGAGGAGVGGDGAGGAAAYRHTAETIDGVTYFTFDDEEEDELPADVEEGEEQSATGSGPVAASWGDGLAAEVLDFLLLKLLMFNVVLPAGRPGANGYASTIERALAQKFGVKVSLDAAAVRRARKGRKHWTTVIVQILCQGANAQHWGRDAVINMIGKAQSPDYIAKVRVWNGKDDAANFRAHVTPLLRQLLDLEDGILASEVLSPLPPLVIEREIDGDACTWRANDKVEGRASVRAQNASGEWVDREDGLGLDEHTHVRVRDLRDAAGAKEQKGQRGRLALVRKVRMFPSLMLCLDGGTWASASGVSVSNREKNHFLSSLTRNEHQRPYRWEWLERGDTVRAWCERVRPGDGAFLQVALTGLTKANNAALALLTREKPRVNTTAEMGAMGAEEEFTPTPVGLFAPSPEQEELHAREARAANAAANAANAAAGRVHDLPYEDEEIENMEPRFDHLTYQSPVCIGGDAPTQRGGAGGGGAGGVGGGGATAGGGGASDAQWYGVDVPLTTRTLVRLPALPEKIGTRALPDASWDDLDVIVRSALCILHAAMRTGEHLITHLTKALRDAYPTDGAVKGAVDAHLNAAFAQLGVRKIATNKDADHKKVYKMSLDGKAVEAFIKDVYDGLVARAPNRSRLWALERSHSRFLRGLTATYKKLGREDDYWALIRALPMLTDYVIGMTSALKMKPKEKDYHLVEEHLALYTVRKAMLWPGSLTWYDTSCLYALGQQMRQWGSLRLVSQEGMEAVSWAWVERACARTRDARSATRLELSARAVVCRLRAQWQKKLNEILRLNNGFANAGAIPKSVHELGVEAVDAYRNARAEDKPSDPRWVYEQALLQQHAQWVEVLEVRDALEKAQDSTTDLAAMDWERFVLLWQRYLACATLHVWSAARVGLRRTARGPSGYYAKLLADYHAYWAPVDVGTRNLSPAIRAKKERAARRKRYAQTRTHVRGAASKDGKRFERIAGLGALVAQHPYLTPTEPATPPPQRAAGERRAAREEDDEMGDEDEWEEEEEVDEDEERWEDDVDEDEDL